MLAAGNYRGRPVRAALGTSSKGTEQIAVEFELIEPAGERMTWYGFFTEATTDRTIESLRHCGWQGNDLSVFVEGEQRVRALVAEGAPGKALSTRLQPWARESRTPAREASSGHEGSVGQRSGGPAGAVMRIGESVMAKCGMAEGKCGRIGAFLLVIQCVSVY